MYYSGFGQAPARHAFTRVPGLDLPLETRKACGRAVQARQYPNLNACYDAVRGGAPVPVDAPMTTTPEEQATSHTRLYVGIGIAVLVLGIGAYLITK